MDTPVVSLGMVYRWCSCLGVWGVALGCGATRMAGWASVRLGVVGGCGVGLVVSEGDFQGGMEEGRGAVGVPGDADVVSGLVPIVWGGSEGEAAFGSDPAFRLRPPRRRCRPAPSFLEHDHHASRSRYHRRRFRRPPRDQRAAHALDVPAPFEAVEAWPMPSGTSLSPASSAGSQRTRHLWPSQTPRQHRTRPSVAYACDRRSSPPSLTCATRNLGSASVHPSCDSPQRLGKRDTRTVRSPARDPP